MTSPATSIRPGSRRRTVHRAGLSLIEILVVVAIIAVLAGIALPMLMLSYQKAIFTRTKADLQLIAVALEAYKADCEGHYPQFDDSNASDIPASGYSAHVLNVQQDRGARLLCRALLGPGPASLSGGGQRVGFQLPDQAPDGADGYGFRKRPGAAGTVYGPYIQSDKFKLGNSAAPFPGYDGMGFTDATLLDHFGNSILYYPAAQGNPVITSLGTGTVKSGFVCSVADGTPQGSAAAPLSRTLYNGFDNNGYGERGTPVLLAYAEMQYVMGDRDNDGYLDTTKNRTAATIQPYLLWTAGADGVYGRGPSGKCDDVCNFDVPADLRK